MEPRYPEACVPYTTTLAMFHCPPAPAHADGAGGLDGRVGDEEGQGGRQDAPGGSECVNTLRSAGYELCEHGVYTGVCVVDGRTVEDDWVAFDASDLAMLRSFTRTILASADRLFVSVFVAVYVLGLCPPDRESQCATCGTTCERAWHYCEDCLRALCPSCVCPCGAEKDP